MDIPFFKDEIDEYDTPSGTTYAQFLKVEKCFKRLKKAYDAKDRKEYRKECRDLEIEVYIFSKYLEQEEIIYAALEADNASDDPIYLKNAEIECLCVEVPIPQK